MSWDFENIAKQLEQDIAVVSDDKSLEAFRIKYLGKKGLIADLYASLASASSAEKPLIGKHANILKSRAAQLIDEKNKEITAGSRGSGAQAIDVTLPGISSSAGHRHILTQTMQDICGLFESLGFVVQEG